MPVPFIRNEREYAETITREKDKLIVLQFTADWCGACSSIGSDVERIAVKHPNVLFFKIDVDKAANKPVAALYGATSLPTFAFVRNSKPLGKVVGAKSAELEQKVYDLSQGDAAAGLGMGEANAPAAGGPEGYQDITPLVTLSQIECLNEKTPRSAQSVFKYDGNALESDVDEQIIICIPFDQTVKIHSIRILPTQERDKAPRTIKLFANQLTLGFDEAADFEPTQTIELTAQDYELSKFIPLRYVKFQHVTNLVIFIEDNIGGEEETALRRIVLFGKKDEVTNVNDLKKNDGTGASAALQGMALGGSGAA